MLNAMNDSTSGNHYPGKKSSILKKIPRISFQEGTHIYTHFMSF